MKKINAFTLSIIGLLSLLGPLATDMYLPAVQHIGEDLVASTQQVQLTLIVYFLGFGMAQLIWGPLSDSFGRRPVLITGTSLFATATVFCAVAPSIEWLIIGRFVQAVSAAALLVVSRVIVVDLYEGQKAAQVMGLATIITAASPMFAPLAGSGILLVADWRYIFLAIGILSIITLIICVLKQPETIDASDLKVMSILTVWNSTVDLIKVRNFSRALTVSAFSFACFSIVIIGAPFFYLNQFSLSPFAFSLAFAVNALGFTISAAFGEKLVETFGIERVLRIGLILLLVTSICAGSAAYLFSIPLWFAIAGLSAVLFAMGIVVPTTMVIALESVSSNKGLASSLLGFFQLSIGAAAAGIFSLIFNGTFYMTLLAISLLSVLAVSVNSFLSSNSEP